MAPHDEKPKIVPLPNGPYYLLNDPEPKVVENLTNSKVPPYRTSAGSPCVGAGGLRTSHFVMGLMEPTASQAKR